MPWEVPDRPGNVPDSTPRLLTHSGRCQAIRQDRESGLFRDLSLFYGLEDSWTSSSFVNGFMAAQKCTGKAMVAMAVQNKILGVLEKNSEPEIFFCGTHLLT